MPISIRVDHREARNGLVGLLAGDTAWALSFSHLAIGDYLIDERLLIERKTLIDLAQSIKDGRLFAQALRMVAALRRKNDQACNRPRARFDDSEGEAFGQIATHPCASSGARSPPSNGENSGASSTLQGRRRPRVDACVLLIEGRMGDLRGSGMRAESIRAALATVSLFIGVPVLRTTCHEESAQLLRSIAGQSRAIVQGGLPRLGVRPKGKRGLQTYLLQGLPGIGPERAARLLDRFGDVRSVIAADEQQLSEVAGIGPATARKIVWSVSEASPIYGSRECRAGLQPVRDQHLEFAADSKVTRIARHQLKIMVQRHGRLQCVRQFPTLSSPYARSEIGNFEGDRQCVEQIEQLQRQPSALFVETRQHLSSRNHRDGARRRVFAQKLRGLGDTVEVIDQDHRIEQIDQSARSHSPRICCCQASPSPLRQRPAVRSRTSPRFGRLSLSSRIRNLRTAWRTSSVIGTLRRWASRSSQSLSSRSRLTRVLVTRTGYHLTTNQDIQSPPRD